MNQEKFGKLIKEIRKKNNLTQKDMADKYGISYQAVSKWENGINMPDISLIKQISKDFEIPIESLLDVNNKRPPKKIGLAIISLLAIVIILTIVIVINNNKSNDFKSKKIKTNCDNFNITGLIAYNNNKSSIYFSVEYCGVDNQEVYKKVDCNLFESSGSYDKLVSSCSSPISQNITLQEYLDNTTVSVDNYSKMCKEYSDNSLYLEINATDQNNKIITYKIPLAFEEDC